MNKIDFHIGDYSRDGHGQSDYVRIECNLSIPQLKQVYREMIVDSGVYFGGLSWREDKEIKEKATHICSDYEDNRFLIHDLDPKYRDALDKEEFDYYDDKHELVLYEDQIILAMMTMIKAYWPAFEYKIVPQQNEYLFNKWGCDGIGYGMYE